VYEADDLGFRPFSMTARARHALKSAHGRFSLRCRIRKWQRNARNRGPIHLQDLDLDHQTCLSIPSRGLVVGNWGRDGPRARLMDWTPVALGADSSELPRRYLGTWYLARLRSSQDPVRHSVRTWKAAVIISQRVIPPGDAAKPATLPFLLLPSPFKDWIASERKEIETARSEM
jgi:hypothetical protein